MKVLALEPYYGGSHQAFLDGWSSRSKHEWTILSLPAYKWKWRMRHAAITFAQQTAKLVSSGQKWDILFCSDMLNLAEFMGLASEHIRQLPSIAYFHENQLTYPVRVEDERDYQFAMTNITTALAATSVWFNSKYHRKEFLTAMESFLKKMPDYQPTDAVEQIRSKAVVQPPGIEPLPQRKGGSTGPLRILWSARWEHDKNPEDFFAAMKMLKEKSTDFRLSVVGQHFREIPEVFAWAKGCFANHIDHWAYQETKRQYEDVLAQADVIVSTARHEFCGLSVIEAISAGAYPLLPKRLSYPELLGLDENPATKHFYDGTVEQLADKLMSLADRKKKQGSLSCDPGLVERFYFCRRAGHLDQALAEVAGH